MPVPTRWEDAGEPDLNGVVWLRKTFELPDSATDAAAELQLGMVDDIDTTFVNGVNVGATVGYNLVRKYPVAAGVLKPGRNVVAVRVLDTGGGGGIWGDEKPRLVLKGKVASPPIELGGPWRYRVGLNLQDGPMPPTGYIGDVNTPTILYNAMIAPLLPYAIAGVVWYQGESNVHREQQYRSLLPALIGDWRHAWGWDFPFLFVQIAPHHDMTPELRDAQLAAMATHAQDRHGRHHRLRRRQRHSPDPQTTGRRAAGASSARWPTVRSSEYSRPGVRIARGQRRRGGAALRPPRGRVDRQGRGAQGLHRRRRRWRLPARARARIREATPWW